MLRHQQRGTLLLRLQQRVDPHSAQRGRGIAPFRGIAAPAKPLLNGVVTGGDAPEKEKSKR